MTDDHQEFARDLAKLRRSIDNLDAAMVHLLAERFRCTQANQNLVIDLPTRQNDGSIDLLCRPARTGVSHS
jgi:hypothetical protein